MMLSCLLNARKGIMMKTINRCDGQFLFNRIYEKYALIATFYVCFKVISAEFVKFHKEKKGVAVSSLYCCQQSVNNIHFSARRSKTKFLFQDSQEYSTNSWKSDNFEKVAS